MHRRDLITGLGAAGILGVAGAQAATAGDPQTPAGNGLVTVRPREDADSRGPQRFAVLDPFGKEIDQSGTRTQGLQEAINYCAEHGYSLLVIGGANTSRGEPWHMNLTASETIEVPPMRFWTWTMRGLTFNGPMKEDFVRFDSLVNSHLDWTGCQLVYTGNQAAVHFKPRTPPPGDPTLGVGVNLIHIPNSIAIYGEHGRCVEFSPAATSGPIFGNKMVFGELNGGANDTASGPRTTSGLVVNTSAGTAMFASNQIDVFAAHGCGRCTFQVGTKNQPDFVKGNFWRLQSTTVPGQTVLSSFETGGLYDIYFENSGLADTVGVRMEAISGGNHIRGYNNCQRPVEEIDGRDSAQQPNTIT